MSQEFPKAPECHDNRHGCRLVCDGMVCQSKCEWKLTMEKHEKKPEGAEARGDVC